MDLSLNEIEAMGKRAARGAGRDWGIAEEAGKAARWLTAGGQPGAELLAALLERTDSQSHESLAPVSLAGEWRAPAGPLCPLAAGAALSDRIRAALVGDGIALGPVLFPLLLAPYAMPEPGAGRAAELSWNGVRLTISPGGGIAAEGEAGALRTEIAGTVRCRGIEAPAAAPPATYARHPVDPEAWRRLAALARRTYAPSTEASRRKGAGAGLTDND